MKVYASLGTLIRLGLIKGQEFEQKTAYFVLGSYCMNNCAFCAMRRSAPKPDENKVRLSRVTWYAVGDTFFAHTKLNDFSRICLQCTTYPGVLKDLEHTLRKIRRAIDMPVSVSIHPLAKNAYMALRREGVERVSVAFDGCTKEVFDNVKGVGIGNRWIWEQFWKGLENALAVFGNATAHLIIGLGENDHDAIKTMIKLRDMGANTALFSYTPTLNRLYGNWTKKIRRPKVGRYRAIQASRYLIYEYGYGLSDFVFDGGRLRGIKGLEDLMSPRAFLTSGCPHCDRPYYNEFPGGVIYNYHRQPTAKEYERDFDTLLDYLMN